MEVFGHETHSDVQEELLDAWSSQRGLQQGDQDLEDRGELHGDLSWSLYQSGFQQTHRALQLQIQLVKTTETPQINQEKSGTQY